MSRMDPRVGGGVEVEGSSVIWEARVDGASIYICFGREEEHHEPKISEGEKHATTSLH